MSLYLGIKLDRGGSTLLRDQLRQQIKDLIDSGSVAAGARLPGTRRLAVDLDVSRSVVTEAYQQLEAEGYLLSRQRSGTVVSERAARGDARLSARPPDPAGALRTTGDEPPIYWDLRSGLADVNAFPRRQWMESLAGVFRSATPRQLGYPPLAGLIELREELAAYLRRVRGVDAAAEQIVVTGGFAQGLALLCHLQLRDGFGTVAVEDPNHPGQRDFMSEIGVRCVPVPVDREGIDVDALARTGARMVLVTPTHQFPTGLVTSQHRREALVAWARRTGSVIVEDDYDGEFWYDSQPQPLALQSLGPDVVAYGGSVSKTLIPGLRLGWLVLPPRLVEPVLRIRSHHDLGMSSVDQLGFMNFMAGGQLDRHLRNMRKRYSARSQAVVVALRERLDGAEVYGHSAGLQRFVALPPGVPEGRVVAEARRSGVVVRGGRHFTMTNRDLPDGLVIGCTFYPPQSLAAAVRLVVDAVETVRR
ncbi:MAG TPA: PLP-dependent aminotransferase family protein [Glycomyces sp.]|nr:PLP-dependent aminotransferase family protein [Glycomyces sp.]